MTRTVLSLCVAVVVGLVGCSREPPPPTTEIVTDMVAAKDIPAGTMIERPLTLFHTGRMYYKGQKPKQGVQFTQMPIGLFPGGLLGATEGKKVARDLKKGETVKQTDIVEYDGSPFVTS